MPKTKPFQTKVAIFDIDGTIFRSSLLIEITNACIDAEIFPKKVKNVYSLAYENWVNRQGSYEKYISAVIEVFEKNIKGVKYSEFIKVARQVINAQQKHTYRYTRDLVKELHKKKYFLLAISNSPKEIVQAFCEHLGFDKVYGRAYEVGKDKKFSGKISFLDLISDKAKIVQRAIEKGNLSLKGSVGVGDSESDIAFLKLVDNPICFNPNKKLYQHAQKKKWGVVVERKDVIYKIC